MKRSAPTWVASRGSARKTTACVLLFGLGRAAFPVDTHVFRVCRRLGLLNGQRTPEKAEAFLAPRLRTRDCHAFHLHLVEHGREVCTAHHPACDRCALADLCAYAQRSTGSAHDRPPSPFLGRTMIRLV